MEEKIVPNSTNTDNESLINSSSSASDSAGTGSNKAYQGRKYLITINNPIDHGFSHDAIKEVLFKSNPAYFCMADEIGDNGTPHTHAFAYFTSPVRFNTLRTRFNGCAHIDPAYGTCEQNRDYVAKSGIHAEGDKAHTSVPGTFEEWGTMPVSNVGRNDKMAVLLEDIKAGKSNTEIIEATPGFGFRAKDIDALRQSILADKYSAEFRTVQVIYIHGPAGTGKVRMIYKAHEAKDICCITTYREGRTDIFDSYRGQPVLVLDEFRSQIPISALLRYIDILPVMLPARYSDKVACYDTVYIVSTLPLGMQYMNEQRKEPDSWAELVRRINKVIEFIADGTFRECTLN